MATETCSINISCSKKVRPCGQVQIHECFALLQVKIILRVTYFNASRAVVVAQLVKWSLPTPEIRGSNPVIGNVLKLWRKDKFKNRPGKAHHLTKTYQNAGEVAQLTDKSILTSDSHRLNPAIDTFYWNNSLLLTVDTKVLR